MKRSRLAAFIVLGVLALASIAQAAKCAKCFKAIPDGQRLCAICQAKEDAKKIGTVDEGALIIEASRARAAYEAALKKLIQHYVNIGDAAKIDRARAELKMLRRVPLHQYIILVDMLGKLTPSKNIEEANRLYEDARLHQSKLTYAGLATSHLREALDRYQDLIIKYPDSDKVAMAAYQMGEVYSAIGIRDHVRAARCYAKCYEWAPQTNLPARYKAARLYDTKLNNPKRAIEIYKLAAEHEVNAKWRAKAKKRLKELTAEDR